MREDFLTTIRDVWTRLGLGEPKIADPRHVRLRIEAFGIDLTDSGNGKILIEGIAGRFPADPAEISRLTRRVLETNLGLLLDSRASVFVKALASGDKGLAVRASYSLAAADIDLLVKTIEDTLGTLEYYAAEFKMTATSIPKQRSAAIPESMDAAMIFRP